MFDMNNYHDNEKEYLERFKKANNVFDDFINSLDELAETF